MTTIHANNAEQALTRLAHSSGVELKTEEPVHRLEPKRVTSTQSAYSADVVVSGLDAGRLESLLTPDKKPFRERLSCSGIAIYSTLEEELPEGIANHSVVLPSEPAALYRRLEAGEEPIEAMAFVDYYRPGEPYPNRGHVLALGLTAPANGREYGLEDAFVARVDQVLRPEGYRFKAAFPEASLLVKEADVRMAGVNIGKVKSKELGPGGRTTRVEMEIDNRFAPIGRDARAILRQKSLLGESYVEITPGSPGAKKLDDGGTLSSANVDDTVELDEVFRTFDPETRKALQQLREDLATAGYWPISVDLSELIKGGGSIKCCTQEIRSRNNEGA
jgi:hypothetical protein